MPNRIIKESICTSDSIDQLTWFEESFFYRLIVNCDDYGRFDARPAILKARLFPLKSVTDKQICDALNKLSTVGIVQVYEYDQKPYLQLVTWEKHQQMRAKKSKYPAFDETCNQMKSDEIKCPRNPIQSNPIRIQSESESNPNICAEQNSPPTITLTLNTGEEYPIYQSDIEEWTSLYPAVDVMQELRNMRGWCSGNAKKRKTRAGIKRFIVAWLAKEQDKGYIGSKGGYSKNDALRAAMAELEAGNE